MEDVYTRDVFPARLLQCFKYEMLTRVQRRVLRAAFAGRDNLLVCAPTGSGKTAVMEAAFLQGFERAAGSAHGKAVYIAPVKALLQERLADWRLRFGESTIGMKFVEISGDTREVDEDEVVGAHVILTTPEKWDAITRGGYGRRCLVGSVELLLVDEIHHIGDESRGGILEALLLRMMNLAKRERDEFSWQPICNLRIIGLSATFSNAKELGDWFKCPEKGLFQFGSEYRPVPLTWRVVGCGDASSSFVFERNLDAQVLKTIRDSSNGKPTIVFCNSRIGAIRLARYLSSEVKRAELLDPNKSERLSHLRKIQKSIADRTLQKTLESGIGFHHAGLNSAEREAVENMFRMSFLPVLCSLAVGVNLPAHLVIVKHTKLYQGRSGYADYPDSQLLQMIGRAGRPSFDRSGTAVVLAESKLVNRLEAVMSGVANLNIRSQLHHCLGEILCAEIVLGGVADIESAKQWFRQSFYAAQEGSTCDIAKVEGVLLRAIEYLELSGMIFRKGKFCLTATPAGGSMCQGCVRVATMKMIVGLDDTKLTLESLLSALSGCVEVQVQVRRNERSLLNQMNETATRYPVRSPEGSLSVTTDTAKTNVLIQAVLSNAELDDHGFGQEVTCIVEEGIRILGVAIDYFQKSANGRTLLLVLRLQRCLILRSWDDNTGPLCLLQVPGVEKSTAAALEYIGLRSIRGLAQANPERIDSFLRRRPAVGQRLIQSAAELKDFHISTSWDPDRKGPLKTLRISISTSKPKLSPGSGSLLIWIASSILHYQRSIDFIYKCEVYIPEDVQEKVFIRFLRDDIVGLDVRVDLDIGSACDSVSEGRQENDDILAKANNLGEARNAPSSILSSIIRLETRHAKARQQEMPKYLVKMKRRLESPTRDSAQQTKPITLGHDHFDCEKNIKREMTATFSTPAFGSGTVDIETRTSKRPKGETNINALCASNMFDKFRFKRNKKTPLPMSEERIVDTVKPHMMPSKDTVKTPKLTCTKPATQRNFCSAEKPGQRTHTSSAPLRYLTSNEEGGIVQDHPILKEYFREKSTLANGPHSILSIARSSIEYSLLGRLFVMPAVEEAPLGSGNFVSTTEDDDVHSEAPRGDDNFDSVFF